MATKRKPTAWKIEGLVEWLTEQIRNGALLDNDRKFSALYGALKEQYADELSGHTLNAPSFKAKVVELVWDNKAEQQLHEFVSRGWKYERFAKYFSWIPEWMFQQERKRLIGQNPAAKSTSFAPGVGRIASPEVLARIEPMELPEASLSNPFVIEVDNPDNMGIFPLNGINLGFRYNRMLNLNEKYNAIGEAERRGYEVILLPGGIFHIDAKTASASNLRTHSARMSGIDFDSDVVDPDYSEEAKRIHDEQPVDELRFEPVSERVANLVRGLHKVFHKKNGVPRFSGRVIAQLGYKEEELIEQAVGAELNYWRQIRQNETLAERKAALAANDGEESPKSLALLKKEKRMRASNYSAEDHRRFFDKILTFFVQEIEGAIPNCTVLGLGSRYIKMGDQLIHLYQPRRETATETNLKMYVEKKLVRQTLKDGPMPNLGLVAGPHNINMSMAVVEHAVEGRRDSTEAWQLPMLVDSAFIREASSDIVRTYRAIEKAVFHEDFEPGVLGLRFVDGFWVAEPYTVPAIQKYRSRKAKDAANKSNPNAGDSKYIYILVDTDPHFGHGWKSRVFDAESRRWLGLGPAVINMMRKGGLFVPGAERIHGFQGLDDGTQGHNFPTEYQPHQNVMPKMILEAHYERLRQEAMRSRNTKAALAKLEEMAQMGLQQDRLRGELWPQRQLNEYIEEMIDPNADFYASIIRRVEASGVIYHGVGSIIGELYDTRDLQAIIFESGNHIAHTVDDAIFEGDFFAQALQRLLAGDERVGAKSIEELQSYISAPKFGNTSIAWGRVGTKGGYAWGMALRAQPAKKTGQGDPIRAAARNLRTRGNYTRIFQGCHAVHVSGDIHRYGFVQMPDMTVISCGSGTDTDPYGERGYSPNNTGNLIYGLPVDGPDSGPIRVIQFRYNDIRDWYENPREIDWERLLPNPV